MNERLNVGQVRYGGDEIEALRLAAELKHVVKDNNEN